MKSFTVIEMARKFTKRPKPVAKGNLRPTRRKIARIVHLLSGREEETAVEIRKKAKLWNKKDSKSHWGLMGKLGKVHPEVLAEIEAIKERGGGIIRAYNINFGEEESV
jgi:hypothetical protein